MGKVTKFLRKVYSKKGSNSLIMNIPMEIAKRQNIFQGDYMEVFETADGILFKKVETLLDKKVDRYEQ